jgi:hypothetical protein
MSRKEKLMLKVNNQRYSLKDSAKTKYLKKNFKIKANWINHLQKGLMIEHLVRFN